MIGLLLALIAVHPTAVELTAEPGEEVSIPLLLAGHGEAVLTGSGVLEADHTVTLDGALRTTVPTRVRADARPGKHESYLYVLSPGNGPLVLASAVQVTAHVSAQDVGSRSVPNSSHVFSAGWPRWALPGAAGMVALCTVLFTMLLRRRLRSDGDSPTTTPQPELQEGF